MEETLVPNFISFNGTITTDLIEIENGNYAFILRGPNNEEFPMINVKSNQKPDLLKGDKISAFGILQKKDNDWVINVDQLLRIPTDEEIKEMD